jgi:hypothetical protein
MATTEERIETLEAKVAEIVQLLKTADPTAISTALVIAEDEAQPADEE